jgi:hypothetical protein
MPLAAVTRLRVRHWRFLPPFVVITFRALRQVRRADGCLGSDVRAKTDRVFWTRSLWRDAEAMRAYMTNGPHRVAMLRLQYWCDEASLVHWEQDALPDWSEAETQLRTAGRLSRVRHPSAAQARGETMPSANI